jgi:O-glycosyl hydrolase
MPTTPSPVGSGAGAADPGPFHAALESLRAAYRTGGVEKPLFQTEYLEGDAMTSVAGMISDTLTHADASAYLVWILARSVQTPGFALVYFDPASGRVETRERYYAVKAFSAFVGEGWRRIDADCANVAVKLSAFAGPGGDLVTILVNPTGDPHRVALTADGDALASAASSLYRSSEGEAGERWRVLGALPAGNVVALPPRSVATVRFTRRPAPPPSR